MTTPSNSPEHPAPETGPTPTEHAEAVTPPGAPAEAVVPPAAPPPGAAPAQPYQPPAPGLAQPYQPPAPEPFAPVARAPRMPWVNPARRGHVAAAAIVGALLFGGGGLLVGHAVSGHGDHRGGMRLERGPGAGGGAPGFGRDPRFRNGGGPRQNVPIGPNGPDLPRPTPTASSSPSR